MSHADSESMLTRSMLTLREIAQRMGQGGNTTARLCDTTAGMGT